MLVTWGVTSYTTQGLGYPWGTQQDTVEPPLPPPLPEPLDPFAPPEPKLTPEEFVLDKLRREALHREHVAKKPFISSPISPQWLNESEVIFRYLRNGAGQLFSIAEIDVIIEALRTPPTAGAPLVGTEAEQEARERAIRSLIGELELEKAGRNE